MVLTVTAYSLVFLGEDNSVKLGDFGLSKMIKSHDFASTYVGTPFYMSPEICAAEKYTLKSDIWSLGCIIYELCALEPPFNAKSHFQLVQKIKEGKITQLPDFYSPELMQVIRDCLKVNPDKRPDTAQLLNLPVVRLMRKEKEVVDVNKALRNREEALANREKELAEGLAQLKNERIYMREELEATVRREWEVKARLEIDSNINIELGKLQQRFEIEVQARVEIELQKRQDISLVDLHSVAASSGTSSSQNSTDSQSTSHSHDTGITTSTAATTNSDTEGCLSVRGIAGHSLDPSVVVMKKNTRTPFTRAQTMFTGHGTAAGCSTPMDIEMASPSPMAIASLSLSPRRNNKIKAPTVHSSNIFAAANDAAGRNKDTQRWNITRDVGLFDSDDDDDDDEEEETVPPSPTRHVKPFQSNSGNKNPFTSKTRPILQTQQSAPIHRLRTLAFNNNNSNKAKATPILPNTHSNSDLSRAAAVAATMRDGFRSPSPTRQLSKIPSAITMGVQATTAITTSSSLELSQSVMSSSCTSDSSGRSASSGSESGTGANVSGLGGNKAHSGKSGAATTGNGNLRRNLSIKKDSSMVVGESVSKPVAASVSSATSTAMTSNKPTPSNPSSAIRGRTLVELQQARAGGRPLSAVMPLTSTTGGTENNLSPKRAYSSNNKELGLRLGERQSSNEQQQPLWDPERDEMPSPFLVRTRNVRV